MHVCISCMNACIAACMHASFCYFVVVVVVVVKQQINQEVKTVKAIHCIQTWSTEEKDSSSTDIWCLSL